MRKLSGGRGSDRDLIYLLLLAKKYDLKPADLHHALVEAERGKKSKCGSISIELRERVEKRLCFMFSHNERSVAQAAISEDSVTKLRSVPPELGRVLNKGTKSLAAERKEDETNIAGLQVGLRHVCLKAKVTDKSEVMAIESRSGSPLALCLVTLSDGTGEIQLPLWNSRIDSVAKNDMVVIRGATVRRFRGQMQLSLRWRTGTISTVHSSTAAQ